MSDMWRTIKLWWFLRLLQKDCIEAGASEVDPMSSYMHRYYTREMDFLQRAAKQAIHPFYENCRCSLCREDGEDEESENDYKLIISKKMSEYSILLDICKRKGYLDTWEIEEETGEKVTCIRLSSEADEMTGLMDLMEDLLSKYKKTWALVIVPILTFILGVHFGNR